MDYIIDNQWKMTLSNECRCVCVGSSYAGQVKEWNIYQGIRSMAYFHIGSTDKRHDAEQQKAIKLREETDMDKFVGAIIRDDAQLKVEIALYLKIASIACLATIAEIIVQIPNGRRYVLQSVMPEVENVIEVSNAFQTGKADVGIMGADWQTQWNLLNNIALSICLPEGDRSYEDKHSFELFGKRYQMGYSSHITKTHVSYCVPEGFEDMGEMQDTKVFAISSDGKTAKITGGKDDNPNRGSVEGVKVGIVVNNLSIDLSIESPDSDAVRKFARQKTLVRLFEEDTQFLNCPDVILDRKMYSDGIRIKALSMRNGQYRLFLIVCNSDGKGAVITIMVTSLYTDQICLKSLMQLADAVFDSVIISGCKKEMLLPFGVPDEYLYKHESSKNPPPGIANDPNVFWSISSTNGTDFQAIPLKKLMAENGHQNTNVYKLITEDEPLYQEDKTALELAKVFRTTREKFHTAYDWEGLIHIGQFLHASMFSSLRSLAWMLAAAANQQNRSIGEYTFAELHPFADVIENKKSHNFESFSYFPGLCDQSDCHVVYITDAVIREGMEEQLLEFCRLPDVPVESLDALRQDLILLEPVMRTIHDGLLANRNRAEVLKGVLAEALAVWCALCVAAKEPFFSEDGPYQSDILVYPEDSMEADPQVIEEASKLSLDYLNRGREIVVISNAKKTQKRKSSSEPVPEAVTPIEEKITEKDVSDAAAKAEKPAQDVEAEGLSVTDIQEASQKRTAEKWYKEYGEILTRNPVIEFKDKTFVFDWLSASDNGRYVSSVEQVIARGGLYRKSVSGATNYFVVRPELGAYAKTNKALEQIQKGKPIQIILETDLQIAFETAPTIAQEKYKINDDGTLDLGGETEIRPRAFEGNNEIHTIYVPEGVTCVGEYAFKNCENLKTVVLPSTLVSLSDCAFEFCESLERINLPDSLKKIGMSVFYGCKSLDDISLPAGLEMLGGSAFQSCDALRSIRIPGKVKTLEYRILSGCDALKNVIIEEGIETIEKYAFDFCPELNDLVLPSTLKSIEEHAFRACPIKNLTILSEKTPPSTDYFDFYELEVCRMPASMRRWVEMNNPFMYRGEDDLTVSYLSAQQINSLKIAASPVPCTQNATQVQTIPSWITDLYITLNNEKLLGKLNRSEDEFYEIYADDFKDECSKGALLQKRREIIANAKPILSVPQEHLDAFKAQSVEHRFAISTGNLFGVDDSEPDFDKKAENAINHSRRYFNIGEMNMVHQLMDQKLKDTRREINEQYDAIEPLWKSFAGAKSHLKVHVCDADTSEREANCIFQKEYGGALVMIKMAKPNMSFMVVRLINCMAWYWKVTPQQIWEQALRNGVEDKRSRYSGNAIDIARGAFNQVFPEVAAAIEREKAERKRKEEEAERNAKIERIKKLEREISDLEYERDNLRGLFKGGKRRKIQEQIDVLQRELNSLK